jgi:hypothetical protein
MTRLRALLESLLTRWAAEAVDYPAGDEDPCPRPLSPLPIHAALRLDAKYDPTGDLL